MRRRGEVNGGRARKVKVASAVNEGWRTGSASLLSAWASVRVNRFRARCCCGGIVAGVVGGACSTLGTEC